MQRKKRVLELLVRGHEAEVAFIAGLTCEARSRPGTWEAWSVRDSIAHNAAWRAHLANALTAVAQGREPVRAGDYEHQNEEIFGRHHGKSWAEIENLAAEAHSSLVEQVSSLSEEDLESIEILPWQGNRPMWRVALGTGFNHPLIHISDHLKQSGQIERAAEIVGELATAVAGLDDSPDWQGVVRYNLACQHSLLGEKASAISELREALALSPGLVDWSKEDPDLEAIRGEPACQAIYDSHDHPAGG